MIFKLVNNIEIENNKYNLIKVFINSNTKNNDNTLDTPIISDLIALPEFANSTSKTNLDFNHICGPCIENKLIQVVI